MAHIKPFKDSTKRESKPGQKPDRWAGFPSRCNANIIAATALVYDIDNKDTMPVIDPAWFVQGFLKFKAVMHPARPASRAIRGEGSLSRLLME
jgi:hypothetical protein